MDPCHHTTTNVFDFDLTSLSKISACRSFHINTLRSKKKYCSMVMISITFYRKHKTYMLASYFVKKFRTFCVLRNYANNWIYGQFHILLRFKYVTNAFIWMCSQLLLKICQNARNQIHLIQLILAHWIHVNFRLIFKHMYVCMLGYAHILD